MKKKLFIILSVLFLVSAPIVLAAGAENYDFELDIKSSGKMIGESYPNSEEISIDIIVQYPINLSADFGSHYVKYDTELFSFVSYSGIEGTKYNEEQFAVYTQQNDISLKAGEKLGTLVLMPKSNKEEVSTTIEYYFFYEFEPFFKSEVTINLAPAEEELVQETLEAEVDKEKEEEKEAFLISPAVFGISILGAIIITAVVVTVINKKKNKTKLEETL